jgi:hypothetical protein
MAVELIRVGILVVLAELELKHKYKIIIDISAYFITAVELGNLL